MLQHMDLIRTDQSSSKTLEMQPILKHFNVPVYLCTEIVFYYVIDSLKAALCGFRKESLASDLSKR